MFTLLNCSVFDWSFEDTQIIQKSPLVTLAHSQKLIILPCSDREGTAHSPRGRALALGLVSSLALNGVIPSSPIVAMTVTGGVEGWRSGRLSKSCQMERMGGLPNNPKDDS